MSDENSSWTIRFENGLQNQQNHHHSEDQEQPQSQSTAMTPIYPLFPNCEEYTLENNVFLGPQILFEDHLNREIITIPPMTPNLVPLAQQPNTSTLVTMIKADIDVFEAAAATPQQYLSDFKPLEYNSSNSPSPSRLDPLNLSHSYRSSHMPSDILNSGNIDHPLAELPQWYNHDFFHTHNHPTNLSLGQILGQLSSPLFNEDDNMSDINRQPVRNPQYTHTLTNSPSSFPNVETNNPTTTLSSPILSPLSDPTIVNDFIIPLCELDNNTSPITLAPSSDTFPQSSFFVSSSPIPISSTTLIPAQTTDTRLIKLPHIGIWTQSQEGFNNEDGHEKTHLIFPSLAQTQAQPHLPTPTHSEKPKTAVKITRSLRAKAAVLPPQITRINPQQNTTLSREERMKGRRIQQQKEGTESPDYTPSTEAPTPTTRSDATQKQQQMAWSRLVNANLRRKEKKLNRGTNLLNKHPQSRTKDTEDK